MLRKLNKSMKERVRRQGNHPQSLSTIESLPAEITQHIANFLDLANAKRLSFASKILHQNLDLRFFNARRDYHVLKQVQLLPIIYNVQEMLGKYREHHQNMMETKTENMTLEAKLSFLYMRKAIALNDDDKNRVISLEHLLNNEKISIEVKGLAIYALLIHFGSEGKKGFIQIALIEAFGKDVMKAIEYYVKENFTTNEKELQGLQKYFLDILKEKNPSWVDWAEQVKHLMKDNNSNNSTSFSNRN